MTDFQTIGDQFVKFYYKTFDSDRSQLAALYKDDSMLSFEKDDVMGASGIVEKLVSLPFGKIEHRIDTLNCQPSNVNGGVLVVVTGALLIEESPRPMSYVQTFQLLPTDAGSYYVFNDVFRLVYPAAD